jgi:hypothetical protein
MFVENVYSNVGSLYLVGKDTLILNLINITLINLYSEN